MKPVRGTILRFVAPILISLVGCSTPADSAPPEIGGSCAKNADCASGLCIAVDSTRRCSRTCVAVVLPCPATYSCGTVAEVSGNVCLPDQGIDCMDRREG